MSLKLLSELKNVLILKHDVCFEFLLLFTQIVENNILDRKIVSNKICIFSRIPQKCYDIRFFYNISGIVLEQIGKTKNR